MRAKWALVVALVMVGCGQTLEAASSGTDGGPSDAHAGDAEAGPGGDGSQDDASGDAIDDSMVDAGDATHDGASGDASGDAIADAIADSAVDARDATHDATSDGPADAGSWSPVCPADAPNVGDSCKGLTTGLQCEYTRLVYLYKVEFDISCDIVRQCTGGLWADESIGVTACDPDGPNATSCPLAYADIKNGASCLAAEKGLRCAYPSGVCVCAVETGGTIVLVDAGPSWSCEPPAGCPMPRPRLGSACGTGGMSETCAYESCGYEETCLDGVWQARELACATPGGSP